MKSGRLSKAELCQLRRAWSILDGLQAKLPAAGNGAENCALNLLLDARNKTGDLLRWQDPGWRALAAK